MSITIVAVVTSLALAGASATAADANVHKAAKAHAARAHAAVHVAARQPYPHYARAPYNYGSRYYNVGQLIQSMLGRGWPALYANLPHGAARGRGTYAPSYDSGPSNDSGPSADPSPAAGPDMAGMNTSTNPTWPALDQ